MKKPQPWPSSGWPTSSGNGACLTTLPPPIVAWPPGIPTARIFGGESAASYVQNLWEAGLLDPSPYAGPNWGDVELKVHRFGTNYLSNHIEELLLGSGNEPFFEQHRFSIDERRQRLESRALDR